MKYEFNSNVLRRDTDRNPIIYPFNSNVLRYDKKAPWQKKSGKITAWWDKPKGRIKPPGVLERKSIDLYKQRPPWETFKSPKAAWDVIPKKQRSELKKRMTTGTAFKPIPARDKKAIGKALGANNFLSVKNPFQSLQEQATINIMRGVSMDLVPEPPEDRYVKMRSGPFRGQWKKVHEEVPIWTEALYRFVTSSMMSAVAYNPEKQEMEIEFVGGAVYRYRNIPERLWTGLINAPSQGKYFWKHIRRFVEEYPYKRVRFMREETVPLPKSLKEKGYKT